MAIHFINHDFCRLSLPVSFTDYGDRSSEKKRTIHVPHGSLSITAPAKDKHAPKGYL